MSLSTLQPQTSLLKFPGYYEFRASCSRQSFSLPESIVFYAAKNPSSMKLYQKLIQTCKYFFIKNPILTYHCLHFEENEWKTCVGGSCYRRQEQDREYRKINMNLNKLQSKLWIDYQLHISSSTSPMASSVASTMYNGCVESLELIRQHISFNDFLFFAPNVRLIFLEESQVVYQNGVEVPYEVIFANLPMVDLLYFQRANQFYDFSNTKCNQTKVVLAFTGTISEEYKEKLAKIVDEILDADSPRTYAPPFIGFIGQLPGKTQAMINLYNS
uniref:Uncharacterized protein n=1 Tax=Panagrolaimus davidi TaxID=227884 RepID=A0A914PRI7_9BILA